jgi:hypothetical protein
MAQRLPWLVLLLVTLLSCGGESPSTEGEGDAGSSTSTSGSGGSATTAPTNTARVQPGDVSYLGAFRLPDVGARPRTFEYGGSAMTFNPSGDPSGSGDGFGGSLYISGHDRLPYGELPNGSQIAEVGIPAPVASTNVGALATAPMLQGFSDVTGGLFANLDEIPRLGMQYLSRGPLGAKIHLAWGQHFQDDPRPSHALFDPSLSSPQPRGAWFIGSESLYSVNGYMLEIPQAWADANVAGRPLGTGRYRDGGWSGMGPALYAYAPWDGGGGLPGNGARLSYTTLLRYESSESSSDVRYRSLSSYQHADEWEGAAWLTTASGKTAVVFAGTKGTGAKFWYGWVNPAGASIPCVERELLGQFTLCYQSDGTPCPSSDLGGCTGHNDYRGWWSSAFAAQLIFFDPGQLAQVAAGSAAPYAPQPYATLALDSHLRLAPEAVDADMVGRGVQRRYRLGDMAYDRANGRLYILELFADGSKPIVHVFRVG